ncbi:MAG: hypothetical protein O3B36_01220 [Proteobacteria bacterium]|nr:hypothetical protein [Pseudomonadota bacterium]
MKIFSKPLLLFFAAVLYFVPIDASVNAKFLASDTPPTYLSEFGFFQDMQNQIPVSTVHPYSLANPLFSDYTDKLRFVYVPKDQKLTYHQDKVFQFPVGSTLIKTFVYLNTHGDMEAQLLETRLLINTSAGWKAISYVWNENQTDAKHSVAGATIPTTFINELGASVDVRYRAPNQNQCKECHQVNKVMTPIGPKARNMDINIQYSNGDMNQLFYWAAQGWIESNLAINSMQSYANESMDIDERARAYLDINCGHCHIPGGSADTTGLYLNLTEDTKEHIGIFKKPVAAGRASGNLKYSIVPGEPNESILLYRMKSLDPGIMMPESGRALADKKGVSLISDWIDQL